MAIYTLFHKRTPYNEIQPGTIALQVGDCPENLSEFRDNTGDNIASWNGLYAENTGIYWIWKNDHDQFKGNHQYRRWLPLTQGIRDGYKVRTVTPLVLSTSLWDQYSTFHSVKDMLLTEHIIKEMLPEYAEDFDRYIKNSRYIYYSAGYLMNSEDYDRWCTFLFGFFDIFKHLRAWETMDDVRESVEEDIRNGQRNSVRGLRYQMQVFGFLAERLWTLWLRHNFKPEEIQTNPYRLMERTGI